MTRLSAVVALAASLATAAPAIAASSECRNLEAQLASVSNGGDRTKIRRYERAIISQKQQLERAKNRQTNSSCSSFLSSLKPHCGEIRSTVDKMERNLLQLQRTKNQIAGGASQAEKARILAELNRNGCRGGTARNEGEERATGLFARLFGSDESAPRKAYNTIGTEKAAKTREASSAQDVAPGNYRTLCVRTCDGYFFPIAYASSPKLFDRDSKACEAMCPGTEVELYYHRVPDEESEAMVSSVSGEPYTELAAAFRYRDPGYERTKACGCNPPKDFSIIAGNLPDQTEEDEVVEQASVVPEPEASPKPAESAQIRTSREGSLTPSAIAELLAPKIAVKDNSDADVAATAAVEPETGQAGPEETGERQIRVVGPSFLPDPAAAIDLRAPGRTELR